MSAATRASYPQYLLICEGYEDRQFFLRLIEAFGLPEFVIVSAGGKDRIGGAISAFKLDQTSIWDGLTHVIIVGDNDDAPDERFEAICGQINEFWGRRLHPGSRRSRQTPNHR